MGYFNRRGQTLCEKLKKQVGSLAKKQDYEIEVTEHYIYDPKSVEEGYRLLNEYLVNAFIREQKKNRGD